MVEYGIVPQWMALLFIFSVVIALTLGVLSGKDRR